MEIDVLIEDHRWESISFESLASVALEATFSKLGLNAGAVEVSFLACDDARISALNSEFRAKPAATNVLSWPAEDLAAQAAGGQPLAPTVAPDGTLSLGDIAIAFDTCEREAREMNKPMTAHVTHLIVHGTLHLLGYDHLSDPDATLMQVIETEILGKMGLDDPYRK